ncbi:phycobilisome protein [Tumidithrix elongata RA019]|uniref:Phycobilisome protein n=1 Tax=Tumidithrix elongata BACA0141 TaxID=2716417 RepID=A0AAW9PZ82_9CYAN|nr:phycobilisome protein [Tumidithrix elongata RA019]
MLSNLQRLSLEVENRYASDTELQFLDNYFQSFSARVDAYGKIKEAEQQIVEKVQLKMRSQDPSIFVKGKEDLNDKWKRDTILVLRYTAITLLFDDPDLLKEQFLYWFQTIMQAFGAQKACDLTYSVMQDVVKQTLPLSVSNLLCPILEMNRNLLGTTSERF